ncbi:MAG: hypothetical protein IT370_35860 [Deltaproteobacteria bacterium]|nr:hypothetical protein [Deltaproteobacteria bacterium]
MRLTIFGLLVSLCAVLLLPGCGDDDEPEVIVEPTLESIQSNVFAKSCVFSSCHTDTKRHSAMDGAIMSMLTMTESCDSLVNVASRRVPGKFRMIPGDPANSYMVAKLNNMIDPVDRAAVDDTTGAGRAMPWSNAPLDMPLLISVQKREAIAEWIRQGAPGCTSGDAGLDGGAGDAGIADAAID